MRNDSEPRLCRVPAKPSRSSDFLVISPFESDHIALDRIFRGMGRTVHYAYTGAEGFECLAEHRVSVVLCEKDLPGGNWRDVLARIPRRPGSPMLVVASRLADEGLWAEVLNRGGYDVVAKPFDASEVPWVVRLAEYEWRRQADAAESAAEAERAASGSAWEPELQPFYFTLPDVYQNS